MTTALRPQFLLHSTSKFFDPRIHAVRGDLADIALAGEIFVPHYAKPVAMQCLLPFIAVRDSAAVDANQTSELLKGEHFMVVDQSGGWAWGYCLHDHYVGYVPEQALGPVTEQADMIVADSVETAKAYLDQPYVWGGRGGAGIDCSGLVQRALAARGIAAPRDSDMQLEALGATLSPTADLRAGDLVFFPGHVGMMTSESDLIHATRHHGKVVIEPLADVIARMAVKYDVPVTARKRLD